MREPGSLYENKRSTSMRKYKVNAVIVFSLNLKEYFDTEVRVAISAYPYGFHCLQYNFDSRSICLLLFRLSGRKLFVNIYDNYEEAKKVKEGAVITVKHSGTNVHGTLQYPRFYRERTDVTWDDLIAS